MEDNGGQERLVLRQSLVGLWVGVLFALMPCLMAFAFVIRWAGDGISINGVPTKNVTSLVFSLTFFSLFIVIGLVLIFYWKNVRIVLSTDGLAVFDFFSRPSFQAEWGQISSYRRGACIKKVFLSTGKESNRWQVWSDGKFGTIPSVHELGQLHSQIIRHLSPDALPSEATPAVPSEGAPTVLEASLKTSRDRYAIGFSIVWYSFMVVAFVGALSQATKRSSDALDTVILIGAVILFAGIPFDLFRAAWRRHRHGRVRLDSDSIWQSDGAREVKIDWGDVRLLELSTIDLGEDGTMKRLTIVSNKDWVQVDDGFRAFPDVVAFAVRHAPNSAAFYV